MMLVTTRPAIVLKKVASRIGTNTSVGCAAPICARNTNTLTGIIVRPEVLSTRNIIIGFDAVSFFVFISCSCSIAFNPIGVAALSSPSILADIFIKMVPITGCPFGMSGKILVSTGDSSREVKAISPPRSPIRIIPIHNDNTPVRPNEISKPVFAELNVESIIAGKTSVSPKPMRRMSETTNAITKKAIQI